MTYTETDTDILQLAANGNEHSARERLREMTPEQWRDLREAIARLDEWLDDTILEQQKRTRARRVKQ